MLDDIGSQDHLGPEVRQLASNGWLGGIAHEVFAGNKSAELVDSRCVDVHAEYL